MKPRTLDELLRETLADDLPAEVEQRMEDALATSFDRGRRRGTAAASRRFPVLLVESAARTLGWAARPQLVAAGSLLVALTGAALHVALGPSAFAASLERLNAAATLAREIEHLAAGGCRVAAKTARPDEHSYTIEWRGDGKTVATLNAGSAGAVVLRMQGESATSSDGRPMAIRRPERESRLADARFGPVEELLSPPELAERMFRSWVLLRIDESDGGATRRFVFREDGSRALYEVIADGVSLQPERIIRHRAERRGGHELATLELTAELTCVGTSAGAVGDGGSR